MDEIKKVLIAGFPVKWSAKKKEDEAFKLLDAYTDYVLSKTHIREFEKQVVKSKLYGQV